jgi:hypothetical protein
VDKVVTLASLINLRPHTLYVPVFWVSVVQDVSQHSQAPAALAAPFTGEGVVTDPLFADLAIISLKISCLHMLLLWVLV